MKEFTVTYSNLNATHNHQTVVANFEAEAIRMVAQRDTLGWNFRITYITETED